MFEFLNNSPFVTYSAVEVPKVTKYSLPLGDVDLGYGLSVGSNGKIKVENPQESNGEREVKFIKDTPEEQNPVYTEEQNPVYAKEYTFTGSPGKFASGRPKQAVEFFKSKLMNELNLDQETADRSAKAIVGNFMFESGDPTLNKTNNVGDKNLGPNGSSFGIGQWRLDRRTALKNFAAKRGKSMSDFMTQLEFAWDEINNSQKGFKILDNLMNSKTIEEATERFMNTFERPNKNPKINKISERIKYAKSL